MEYYTLLDKVYEAYYDCRKNKGRKKSAIQFSWNYEKELKKLTDELYDKSYHPTTSIVFPVTRPKHREVFAANFRDRIVHHLLMNEFGSLLEDEMIEDSYNCRVGKGNLYGIKRLEEKIKIISKNYTVKTYALSCDIQGFFMSIDKKRLWQMLETLIRDKYKGEDIEWWLRLFKIVIMHRPELDCEIRGDKKILDALPDIKTLFRSNGKGIPIGNLPSQICGNYYLTPFDWFVIKLLGKDGFYCRFVDDFKVISNDKKMLQKIAVECRNYLRDYLGLVLHPQKISITDVTKGLPFIGFAVVPWGLYTSNRVISNAFYRFSDDETDAEKMIACYNSYMGFLIQCKTYGIRWRLYNSLSDKRKNEVECIDMKKYKLKENNK